MMQQDTLFLYAIADGGAARPPVGFQGVGGAPITLVRDAGFCAVVSKHAAGDLEYLMDGTPRQRIEKAILAYHQCLHALSQTLDLLPVRFGTLLPRQAGFEMFVKQNAEALTHALNHTRGHLEWTIRLRKAARPADEVSLTRPQDYLRQRQHQNHTAREAAQKRDAFAQRVADHIKLCPARDVMSEPVHRDGADKSCFAILKALNPRGRDAALLERLSAIVQSVPDVDMDVFGPDAPYRFATAGQTHHAG